MLYSEARDAASSSYSAKGCGRIVLNPKFKVSEQHPDTSVLSPVVTELSAAVSKLKGGGEVLLNEPPRALHDDTC